MESKRSIRLIIAVMFLLLVPAGRALSQKKEDIDALRRRLAEQEEYLRRQDQQLQTQQDEMKRLMEEIENLKQRIEEMEQSAKKSAPTPDAGGQVQAQAHKRDSIGDLNAASVAAGSFPGSFVIPGTQQVSLAIGGFVKTVAIADTNAEAQGSNMLPSMIGTQRDDTRGKFAIDSTLTRLNIDARAPARNGSLRGYIEYDLNASNNNSLSFKLRHAYGFWETGIGRLTMGHAWSTLMDLKVLPEGLTEPTVSGAIFTRQALIRWTQNLGESLKADLAVEHPSGTDVFVDSGTSQTFRSQIRIPDFIAAIEYNRSGIGHVRVGGIVRRLQLANVDESIRISATGWGISLGTHLNTFGNDKLAFTGSYGSGLGRYLLGLGSNAGGMYDPQEERLRVRDNYGGAVWYQHHWSASLRSTGAVGIARSDPFASQPGNEFKKTTYAYGNLMWTILPYLNLGFEYDYGRRNVKDGTYKDNHRIMFGMQIF